MAKTSKIIIAEGIKLDSTYKNVLSYSQNDMLTLVTTKQVASAGNYSFIRQEKNTVQVGFSYSQICNANYMAFQNKDYNNRWFFAFIKDIQYINDGCVNIVFDIDVWSTFYESMNIMKCFVEREHVNDDTIGKHTVPENLNIGDVIEESEESFTSLNTKTYIGVLSSWEIKSGTHTGGDDGGTQFDGVTLYNKGVFGKKLYIFENSITKQPLDIYRDTTPNINYLTNFLRITNIDGHIADISDMFVIPSSLITENNLEKIEATRMPEEITTKFWKFREPTQANPLSDAELVERTTAKTESKNVTKLTSFTGYTPKNNKCFVYPYNYLYVTNDNGNTNILKYELFSDTTANFQLQLALSVGISGRCVPLNYKGVAYNDDEGIPLGKFPTCQWSADAYTNWLTQQAVNIPTKIVSGIVNTGLNVAQGNWVNAGLSTANSIASMIGDFYKANLMPNIEGGGNTGDVSYSNANNTIYFRKMRCKNEYISIIDSYFNRFGYKINETKTPNLTGRTYWNYIKIGGADRFATGNIQSKFLDVINNIAQQGTTIWHDHANIGNYSLTNTIVVSGS